MTLNDLKMHKSTKKMNFLICLNCMYLPESSDVIEVRDCSTNLLIIPSSGLWFILDNIVLDLINNELLSISLNY